MPTHNEAMQEAIAACPPSARVFYTLEIWQSSFAEPARVVANVGEDMVLGIEAGALLRIISRQRAGSELNQHATIMRRAGLDAEKHIVADIGDDARRLVKRRLPDFQRMEDARARRTRGIRLEERFIVCRHD